MNWKKVKEVAWFVFIFCLSVKLIEYSGSDQFLNIAGNLFGAMALVGLGAYEVLNEEE